LNAELRKDNKKLQGEVEFYKIQCKQLKEERGK